LPSTLSSNVGPSPLPNCWELSVSVPPFGQSLGAVYNPFFTRCSMGGARGLFVFRWGTPRSLTPEVPLFNWSPLIPFPLEQMGFFPFFFQSPFGRGLGRGLSGLYRSRINFASKLWSVSFPSMGKTLAAANGDMEENHP